MVPSGTKTNIFQTQENINRSTIIENNKKGKMEEHRMKKIDNSPKYYNSSHQIYRNGRVPGNTFEQQKNKSLTNEVDQLVLTETK